jgi:hypothetical protein
MSKSQAIAEALSILNEDGLMMPGDTAYRIVVRTIASQIDQLGPEAALEQVRDTKAHLLSQIHQMCM